MAKEKRWLRNASAKRITCWDAAPPSHRERAAVRFCNSRASHLSEFEQQACIYVPDALQFAGAHLRRLERDHVGTSSCEPHDAATERPAFRPPMPQSVAPGS